MVCLKISLLPNVSDGPCVDFEERMKEIKEDVSVHTLTPPLSHLHSHTHPHPPLIPTPHTHPYTHLPPAGREVQGVSQREEERS